MSVPENLHVWKPLLLGGAAIGAARLLYWALFRRPRLHVKDKVVLITGASSGIGRALAEELHRAGARVILAARSIDKLQEVCEYLKNKEIVGSTEPIYRYLDLADPNGLESAVAELGAIYGHIDILINNAGMSMRGSCAETDIKVHRQLMEVNYFGQIRITQSILPYMTAERGAIVVINSVQGKIAIPQRSAYAASKHALLAYFDSLRAEIAADQRDIL